MRHWKPWDWIAYAALLTAAVILAADAALKSAPNVEVKMPTFMHSEWWAFVPVVLVLAGTAILLARNFGFLGRRVNDPAVRAQPLRGNHASTPAGTASAEVGRDMQAHLSLHFDEHIEKCVASNVIHGPSPVKTKYFRVRVTSDTSVDAWGLLESVERLGIDGRWSPREPRDRFFLQWMDGQFGPMGLGRNFPAYLDLFFIDENSGRIRLVTPTGAQSSEFMFGVAYRFNLSVHETGGASKNGSLTIKQGTTWDDFETGFSTP